MPRLRGPLPADLDHEGSAARQPLTRARGARVAAAALFAAALLAGADATLAQQGEAAGASAQMFAPAALAPASFVEPGPLRVEVIDLDLHDAARSRTLPAKLRVPQPCDAATRRPLVLFSHGLGGSRAGGAAWGEHWASHGFAVLHIQHPGSDESLWRGRPGGFRPETLKEGTSPERYVDRLRDVPAALESIAARIAASPELACIDVERIGMSGHSFGALTTMAIAGQRLPRPGGAPAAWAREPRVVAAIAFSPSVREGPMGRASLASVDLPFLTVTGSRDGDVMGTGATPETRRAVFDALPPGVRRLLWLDGADHMVFNGGPPRPATAGTPGDDRRVQRAVAAVTLAFWRSTLAADAAAIAWLDGDGPRGLLGPGDRWMPR